MNIMQATDCFAVPGDTNSIIDMVKPDTGRSWCYDQTLEEIRQRYPGAERMKFDDFMRGKIAAQAAEPMEWHEVAEEVYHDMLNVLPPAAWKGGAFLVGEATDHCAATGRPRFTCYKREGTTHFELQRPITHKQFCEIFGNCPNGYLE